MNSNLEIRSIHRRATSSRQYRLLRATAVATALLVLAARAEADDAVVPDSPNDPVHLTLPAPSGEHAIGTLSLHLIDYARQDPYWSTPHPRELMVSLWYPARASESDNLAPWMQRVALSVFRPQLADTFRELLNPVKGPPVGPNPISLDGVRFPVTHAMRGAPVGGFGDPRSDEQNPSRYPVVLFSPGYGFDREQGTALVEDLASHGYVVVTISHTYESAEVEFPGGQVELGGHDLDTLPQVAVAVRRDDARFVLDKLHEIAAGVNPDIEQHRLPRGLGASMDLTKVGMFGHSIGGATAIQTMAHDPRVVAGIDMDGAVITDLDPFHSPPSQIAAAMTQLAVQLGDRPFMILSSDGRFGGGLQRFFGPYLNAFWGSMTGWRRFLAVDGAEHLFFTDDEVLLKECLIAGLVPLPDDRHLIDPDRAVAVERAYILAFFDQWLRQRDSRLLDGPSPQFPEVLFF